LLERLRRRPKVAPELLGRIRIEPLQHIEAPGVEIRDRFRYGDRAAEKALRGV
jgi:hypothetical protein